MNKTLYAFLLGLVIFALLAFCIPPPAPTPTPIPPPTATQAPSMTITPLLPTATNPPADTPTAIIVPTPTTVLPSSTVPVRLTPSSAPTFTPEFPTLTFTITIQPPAASTTPTTKPPEERDTPTPPTKVYYTYTPQKSSPFCPVGGECDLMLDTDTLLDDDMLRVRFFNNGANTATITVNVSVDNAWSQSLSDVIEPGTTGETVFTVPCVQNGKNLKIEILYPGYIANQLIEYPVCICE